MIPRPAIFGALLAVGTFSNAYPLVAVMLFFWALWATWKKPKKPSVYLLALTGSIWVSAIWSPNAIMPAALGVIVLSIGIVAKDVRSTWDINSFVVGMFVGVAPQLFAAFTTWGASRPRLLSLNASQIGQTGLMFWLIMPELPKSKQLHAFLPATIQMAVSVARAPMLAGFIYVLAKPSKQRLMMFATIVAVFVVAGLSQGNLSRVLLPNNLTTVETRINLVIDPAEQTRSIPADLVPIVEKPVLSWTGYGVGNYVNETGLIRPHNVFILAFYQMGVLALVPVLLLGWAVFTRRIPLSVFVALFFLWQFTEEANGRVEGFFTTAAVLCAVWRPHATTWEIKPAMRTLKNRMRLQTP